MSYKNESDVIKALEELLETEDNYDVIIHVGKIPNFKEFHMHAHSGILGCRSKYFNNLLSDNNTQKQNGKYVINKQNFTPQAYEVIIKYFYTGHINISNRTGTELLDIMIASDELKLEELTKLTEDFIIDNHHQFLRIVPVGILQIEVILKRDDLNLIEIVIWENLIKWGLARVQQGLNRGDFKWSQDS
ncbi:BTB/POZ protein [Glomus cerebriforme]|uniref:BTB/POZ protein n=1 Tax=Glomus cerebriforme TaxID=658196 RepID=A0A397TT30_9GLOM|nr:BTB/POZ protein [Glomus cerebriforme]